MSWLTSIFNIFKKGDSVEISTSHDLSALKAAIKLLADAAVDTEKVVASGGNPLVALFTYKNLIPDVVALVPVAGNIPTEGKAMVPADYVVLVTELAKDLGVTDAHAGVIIDSALALLTELVTVVLPQVETLALDVKKPIIIAHAT